MLYPLKWMTERGNDFRGVLTRGQIEVLPFPAQPSIAYFSLRSGVLILDSKICAFQKLLTVY